MTKIEEQLMIDEGFRSKPYSDTVGKLTIGYGRNLDDVGITRNEAFQMLLLPDRLHHRGLRTGEDLADLRPIDLLDG